MDCFVFNFFICSLLVLAFIYACYVFYDTVKDSEEKRSRERMKNHKIDYITNQVYFNNNKIDKVQKDLNFLNYKVEQIIDFINDNECSVKDDE